MSDTIEDIRARHATTILRADGSHAAFHAHYDRATLLAEVDRLTRERDEARAEVGRLRKKMREIAEDCESEYPESYKWIAWGIRIALEAKP